METLLIILAIAIWFEGITKIEIRKIEKYDNEATTALIVGSVAILATLIIVMLTGFQHGDLSGLSLLL